MIICTKCKKRMRCDRNGMIARWGSGHCYRGDRYKCSECAAEIIVCNPESYYSTAPVSNGYLMQMDPEDD